MLICAVDDVSIILLLNALPITYLLLISELDYMLKQYDFKYYYTKPKVKKKKKKTKVLRVAKYLPSLPKVSFSFFDEETKEKPVSPLMGLDEMGRTPLHWACSEKCPKHLLFRLYHSQREAASIKDSNGNLPLHLALNFDRNPEVVNKLIKAYVPGSWMPDANGKTPLTLAFEIAKQKQVEENSPVCRTYWAFPSDPRAQNWQQAQERIWKTVEFLLENRSIRHKNITPVEYKLLIEALKHAAPPKVVQLMMDTAKASFKNESLVTAALSLCISRQYPLPILKKMLEMAPNNFVKLQYRDSTGRGIVAAHYRVGCLVRRDENDKEYSLRDVMQKIANMKPEERKTYVPSYQYLEWYEKLKVLINLWASAKFDEEDAEEAAEEWLLHNALANSDVPPSLIELLAHLNPNAIDLKHPKSLALPIHAACRLWRYRIFPPRKHEKEISMDRVIPLMLVGDAKRTRKQYKGRLPLHHAIVANKPWQFLKGLVVADPQTLHMRDVTTGLFPFQLAACRDDIPWNKTETTMYQFTSDEWRKMRGYQRDHQIRRVEQEYRLEQLTSIYELLRHSPDAIDQKLLEQKEQERLSKSTASRPLEQKEMDVSEHVKTTMQLKQIRSMFGIGNVSAHFILWSYKERRLGWKTHRSNLALIKEAVIDGFISIGLDSWWRKMKFMIWHDNKLDNLPNRDEYLLHAALSNSDVPPWVVAILLECFPRSSSLPLPGTNGEKYPLHLACETSRYVYLSFEFQHPKTTLELVLDTYPEAAKLLWNGRLPLFIAIESGKTWDEIKGFVEHDPKCSMALDTVTNMMPYQLAALHRKYPKSKRAYFEKKAMSEAGYEAWKTSSKMQKSIHLDNEMRKHDIDRVGTIWELLVRSQREASKKNDDDEGSMEGDLEAVLGNSMHVSFYDPWAKKTLRDSLHESSFHESSFHESSLHESNSVLGESFSEFHEDSDDDDPFHFEDDQDEDQKKVSFGQDTLP
jgi:hypothetical protein